MFRIKKAVSLLLVILCMASMLAGCKIELPSKVTSQAQSSSVVSAADNSASLSQSENSSVHSAVSSSKPESAGSQIIASSKSTTSKSTTSSHATVKPQSTAPIQNKQLTCTLLISCKTLLNHMNELDQGTKSILPKDGIIYAKHTVEMKDGETVFDVLLCETRASKILFDFQTTPAYNSKYITQIGGLGHISTLNDSGWMYRVNGKFLQAGCSAVKLKSGDSIEWHYTCDTGRDLT